MRIHVLASGSGGNATLFESARTRVLVDAGISRRTLKRRLSEAQAGPPTAVLVTHAHGDHARHAGEVALRYGIPVHASESTVRAVAWSPLVDVRPFGAREPFAIGDFEVAPLPVPHDAAQVALRLTVGARSAAIATDLGEVPAALPDHLAGCEAVLVESNHDLEMLERGPYAPWLKRRVASSGGHLSNAQTHGLLRALSPATRTVVLLHLSETNNRPALALESAADALAGRGVRLVAAAPRGVTPVLA